MFFSKFTFTLEIQFEIQNSLIFFDAAAQSVKDTEANSDIAPSNRVGSWLSVNDSLWGKLRLSPSGSNTC